MEAVVNATTLDVLKLAVWATVKAPTWEVIKALTWLSSNTLMLPAFKAAMSADSILIN